jgi:serine protease
MSRIRLILLVFAVSLALLVMLGLPLRGQPLGQRARVLVSRFAPPPLLRGIIPVALRGPGSSDAKLRRSLRVVGRTMDRRGASGAPYRPGRIIVKFKDGVSSAQRLAALSSASRTASLGPRPSSANFDIVQIDPNEDAEAVAAAFGRRSDVQYAQAAYRVYPTLVPNDPFYPNQWNFPMIDMARAWDLQPSAGSSIVVAVLDTGVAYTAATFNFHASAFCLDPQDNYYPPPCPPGTVSYPALGNLTLPFVAADDLASPGRFVAPYDFIWNDNMPVDTDGHGTHVSGTIGELTNNGVGAAGIAFNSQIMPVKVLDSVWDDIFGSPNVGTDDVVAQGIRYAVDNGAKVLNMSLGRTGPPAPVLEDAMNYAVGKGAFIAVAAGNDYQNGNPLEVIAEIASRINGAVSVAAVNQSMGHAEYSSSGTWVELTAPGGSFQGFGANGGILQETLDFDLVDTYTLPLEQFTAPRFDSLAYFYLTGTSMATAHVSGVAAMLMQQGITDPAAVEAALEHFATDLGSPGRDVLFGFGLIEARSGLRGLGLAR